jgi:hypothetical protein
MVYYVYICGVNNLSNFINSGLLNDLCTMRMKYLYIGHLLLVFWGLSGCGPSVANVDTVEQLAGFHSAVGDSLSRTTSKKFNGLADLYVDFSGSMKVGITKNYDYLKSTISGLPEDGARGFILQNELFETDLDSITRIQGGRCYALNTDHYHFERSSLGLVTASIVKRGKTALFVTDFCREDNETNKQPGCPGKPPVKIAFNNSDWARRDFAQWLCDGNGISVYSKADLESEDKNSSTIFFILFWEKGDTASQSVFARLGDELEATSGFVRLDFCKSFSHVWMNADAKASGSHGLGSEITSLRHWENKAAGYAYYEVSRDVITSNMELDSFAEQKILLENLFCQDQVAGAEPLKFRLEAHDITAALHTFQERADNAKEAQASESVDADEDSSTLGKGIQRSSWPTTDIFRLVPTETGPSTVELKIQVPEPRTLPLEASVFRLDIIQAARSVAWDAKWEKHLSWEYMPCIEMGALAGSLKGALRECQPEERLIFTFYVEISN